MILVLLQLLTCTNAGNFCVDEVNREEYSGPGGQFTGNDVDIEKAASAFSRGCKKSYKEFNLAINYEDTKNGCENSRKLHEFVQTQDDDTDYEVLEQFLQIPSFASDIYRSEYVSGYYLTPLALTILQEKLNFAKVLIKNGANINVKVDGAPLLYHAIDAKDHSGDSMFLFLLRNKADVNLKATERKYEDVSALQYCVIHKKRAMMKELLKYVSYSSLYSTNNDSENVLNTAIKSNYMEFVRDLVEEHNMSVNSEQGSKPPLMTAIEYGRTDMISFLLNNNAELYFNWRGHTAFSTAADCKNVIMIKQLIKDPKIDINCKDIKYGEYVMNLVHDLYEVSKMQNLELDNNSITQLIKERKTSLSVDIIDTLNKNEKWDELQQKLDAAEYTARLIKNAQQNIVTQYTDRLYTNAINLSNKIINLEENTINLRDNVESVCESEEEEEEE